jgi:hypothetical protein
MSFDQWNNQADAINLNQWLASQQPKRVAPKKKGRGGFASSLISEAGGTGGALTGAAIGTALLPGIGTVIGAGLGGAIGGFGGRIAENEVRDNRVGLGDALTEGAISGVTAAGPLKLLKAGKALKGAAKAAPALEDAIVEAGTKAPLKTSAQGKLLDLSNSALLKQYGTVPSYTARQINPKATVGSLADLGITKPQDVERISRAVTGTNGLINKAVVGAVDKSTIVPVDTIQSTLQKAIGEHGLVDKDAQSVTNVVNAQLGKLEGGATPAKVFDVMKQLEKRTANLQGKGGNYRLTTPERMDQAKVLMSVKDELEKNLYEAAGANKNLSSVLTPELRDNLVKLHPGNQQWQDFVDSKVMKAGSVKDLRSTMAPFVRGSKLVDEANLNEGTFGGRVGNLAQAGQGSLANTMALLAGNAVKNPALQAASKGLRSAAGQAVPGAINTGAKGIIARQATGDIAKTVFAPAPANAQSLEEAMTQANGGQGGGVPGLYDSPSGNLDSWNPDDPMAQDPNVQQMPYSKQNLVADIQRDPKNASKYLDYYTQLDAIFNPPAPKDVGPGYTKPSAQQYAQGLTGIQSVGNLEQMVNSNPDVVNRAAVPGQGLPVVGGLVSRATGSSSYRGTGNNILNSIARINTGANMPESERKFYEQTYLPQPGDPPETIQKKLATLRQFFSPIVNYQSSPSSSLSDALMAAQQQGAY